MPADNGFSVTDQLQPYQWSNEETSAYEAAIEAVNGAVGAYSALIAAEEAKPAPDHHVIAEARQQQGKLAREREQLSSENPNEIAAARAHYAQLAAEVMGRIA